MICNIVLYLLLGMHYYVCGSKSYTRFVMSQCLKDICCHFPATEKNNKLSMYNITVWFPWLLTISN